MLANIFGALAQHTLHIAIEPFAFMHEMRDCLHDFDQDEMIEGPLRAYFLAALWTGDSS
jgi:hypothetical protein